jgi:hypothetical protein
MALSTHGPEAVIQTHAQYAFHQVRDIYEFPMQSFKHLLDYMQLWFPGVNYIVSFPVFQHILHLQGECGRRRSEPIYGTYRGCMGRGALTPTVKPTYQSTISFHLIHPEASDRNMHQNNGRDSAHNVDKF